VHHLTDIKIGRHEHLPFVVAIQNIIEATVVSRRERLFIFCGFVGVQILDIDLYGFLHGA
jgi:hypothetical protein